MGALPERRTSLVDEVTQLVASNVSQRLSDGDTTVESLTNLHVLS
jgi:hypothetical protein